MTLARAWTRQIFGASAAALIAPGAIVASLAALALAGGFGQLGSLGQALSGPAVPAATEFALGGSARHGAAAVNAAAIPGTVATPSRPAGTAAPGSGGAAPASKPGVPGSGPSARGGPGNAGSGTSAGQGSRGGSAPTTGTTSSAGSSGGPTSPQPKPPTLTDRVVSTATSVTSQVPGAAGQLATGVLESAGATADQALPPSTGSSSSSGSLLPGLHLP